MSTIGLTNAEASLRLKQFGPNAMPDTSAHPLRSALAKFWAPVPWMLEAVILIELGLHNYVESSVIAVLLIFNATLSFIQESRAQATLAALRSKLALTASVLREGKWLTIPAANLVPGDNVKLYLGGVVAADARILEGSVLLDQSMITGESIPIEGEAGLQTFAGALVRRGEALAEVTATGIKTKFGRTAELVSNARSVSTEQKVVFHVVRNLVLFNCSVIVLLVAYSLMHSLPFREIVPLLLTAILMAVPVALPATFTLAGALGAKSLAKKGVLPSRLSAVEEAATMDVLCVDKTGTLTQNTLSVTEVRATAGFDEAHVLGLAALASSEGGQDSVDVAIRKAAFAHQINDLPKLSHFSPFDPAVKMSEATATGSNGAVLRIVKGAFRVVAGLTSASGSAPASDLATADAELEAKGYRVLAVAVGAAQSLKLAGLIALSDPPRADSAVLIQELDELGVRTIMVTGDAPATAATVARAVGLTGKVSPTLEIPPGLKPEDFGVFAGVLPEGKYDLVKIFQRSGHTVGMCGDGANDAPALRQAQMGIAVSTATDVAKSAAGIILTTPGLEGIVHSVKEGRMIFQRLLTYTLKSVTHKFTGLLFLFAGILMTGHSILTPKLLVISLITGDFLSMISATDKVRISPKVSVWRVQSLTLAGVILGFCNLIFCMGILAFGKYYEGFNLESLQTLSIVTLIFGGQAILYVVRERRHLWSSRPSGWLMLASAADLLIISTLAITGTFMTPLPVPVIVGVLITSVIFGFCLDLVKVPIFRYLKIV